MIFFNSPILDNTLIVRNNLGKIISIKKENNQYENVQINNIVEKIDENYFDKTFQTKIDELDIDEYQTEPIEFPYTGIDQAFFILELNPNITENIPDEDVDGVGGTTITSAGGSTGTLNPTSAGDSSGMINP